MNDNRKAEAGVLRQDETPFTLNIDPNLQFSVIEKEHGKRPVGLIDVAYCDAFYPDYPYTRYRAYSTSLGAFRPFWCRGDRPVAPTDPMQC